MKNPKSKLKVDNDMYHTFQKDEYPIYILLPLSLWVLLIPPLRKFLLPSIFSEFLGIPAAEVFMDYLRLVSKICVSLVTIVIVIDLLSTQKFDVISTNHKLLHHIIIYFLHNHFLKAVSFFLDYHVSVVYFTQD